MKAVVIREHGGYDRLRFEDRPEPTPGCGEVRVRLRASGLNHLDTWVRRGVPGHTFPLPLVPGCDGAGVVDAVGTGVAARKVGDAVVLAPGVSCGVCRACASGRDSLCRSYGILGEMRDGTCAEAVVVPERNAIACPKGLSFEEAASVPLVFLTAWHMVVARAELRPGETILVQAAGSGVSTAAIQIARLLGAGRILATTSTAEKAERARALGADEVIDYSKEDVAARVRDLTAKAGVDVVIDHVGAATFQGSMKSLAKGGRLVTCGATSGPRAEVHLNLLFFKSLSVLGSTMGSLGEVHEVLSHVAAGRLRPVVDTVLPLSEVAEAHRRLESRDVFGKIVLVPDASARSGVGGDGVR
jgi:NADPH:quinone reductase-like Zn-dependent oxidoreductase